MEYIDRPGDFQARVIDYSIYQAKTGSTGINLKFQLLTMWNPETQEWEDWTQYGGHEVLGTAWVINKDETLNEANVKRLAEACGPWDFGMIDSKEWRPTDCSVTVQAEEYQGKTTLKVAWINPYDRKPGMSGNVDAGKARDLSSRFGHQLRALFGNTQRNAAVPSSRPKPPPAGKFTSQKREDDSFDPSTFANGAVPAPLAGDDIPY